ncbi:MAG TPA: hypothetical protein VNH18_06310 [Bryobacteraceae bacterium]|nr:hypothetical protein [Bryobacteraceae bacterium]
MWRNLLSLLKNSGNVQPSTHGQPVRAGARVVIVALINNQQDQQTLTEIAADYGWSLHFAQTSREALTLLNRYEAPIVLCDRDATSSDWQEAIQTMAASQHLVYPILVSRVADDYLWNEVMRSGGFDLLAKPLRGEEVLRTIRMAWSYWNWSSSMGTQYVPIKRRR